MTEPTRTPVPIQLPALCLVVLIGASSSGKSSFARRHFKPTEVLTSDFFRAVVSDDENSLEATNDAFETLHFVAAKRLARGLLTVVDATNVQPQDRAHLVALARRHDVLPVAIVLDLPEAELLARHAARPDRDFPAGVIARQRGNLRRSLGKLPGEGFRGVWVLRSAEEVDAVRVERTPLYNDRRDETGPFDFVGDVHGCLDELRELLGKLGYAVHDDLSVTPPPGRRAVFVGDLVDRGPDTPGVLRLVMGMVRAGTALCVPGNHDDKLRRALAGQKVQVAHGLEASLAQLEPETPEFRAEAQAFLKSLVSHYVLDGGRVVVAHAGMKERYQGRASGRVRDFALYGETTGETDEFGLPVRLNWAVDYRGKALVVYGHTPVPDAQFLNNTANIDTGCVFGGRLTALRYPEREFVTVPARREYAVPKRPLAPDGLSAQQRHDELLDLADVTGKRAIETGLRGRVLVQENETAAALEVLGRFAVDPRLLVYLPPTMSPSETSREEGYLEHPREAFAFYAREGAARVVLEEKHMGSRAVVVVARDADALRARFGVDDGSAGVVYTRTGRPFFSDAALGAALLDRLRGAMTRAGFWEAHGTSWAVLDAELLPWSLKAGDLLRGQYALAGAAGGHALGREANALDAAVARGLDLQNLLERTRERHGLLGAYREAYRRYVWRVNGVDDLKLAPFHLLATEGAVHHDKTHLWHLDELAKICREDEGVLLATAHHTVALGDAESEAGGVAWWLDLTARGGEGAVVKPLDFVHRGPRGLSQPGVKVRGREYLRLIYGPEYTLPEHLDRLRERGLAGKRALALKEFALGMEGLSRFVAGAPLRRVHECALGVLALESDPVDPRL